jgi:2-polyprenyl-6-methoxyphenol hydroxylase-like FAD-dependent oxidoreductase
MKTLILGAGPAGLYLAYLLKRQNPTDEVRIVEQNPADSTFGFGVVFSDRALDFLRDDDAETHDLIVPGMQRWHDLTLVHRNERVTIDGVGFAAIGRLQLLQAMQQRLHSVGITPEYRHTVTDERELAGFDLVVAADGANSFVRRGLEREFGTRIEPLANKFVWYGTTQRFETLSQTFVTTEAGTFNAHHYRYSDTMSTFIVECDPQTWARAGFEHMDEAQSRTYNEELFAQTLGGHALITNKSVWRNFQKVSNQRWSVGNRALVGDALRTAHFSIGSGTRLAFEDTIVLARALREQRNDVPAALAAYETARRPIVDKLVTGANRSADWYEHFPEHMQLEPWAMAWSYIQRSGRVDAEKLRLVSPRFVAGCEARGVS